LDKWLEHDLRAGRLTQNWKIPEDQITNLKTKIKTIQNKNQAAKYG
jgi:hypothetical protein